MIEREPAPLLSDGLGRTNKRRDGEMELIAAPDIKAEIAAPDNVIKSS